MVFAYRHLVIAFVLAITLTQAASTYASSLIASTVHETVTISDLLLSQGTGATEIPSWGLLGDAANVVITHELVGGYNANLVFTSGSVRGEVTNGNWFSDAKISILPNGGTHISAFGADGQAVTSIGAVHAFDGVDTSIFSDPNPGGGQMIPAGPAVFQFHEASDFDEAPLAADNTFTDLTIEFAEGIASDGIFSLGSLTSGTPYTATHGHAPGGRDFLTFTLPTSGTIDIETFEATDGTWGFAMQDTEIGLFDSTGALIRQHDDILADPPVTTPPTPENSYSALDNVALAAGEYTLVTTTWNSSLNGPMTIGDDIGDVTAGSDFGDFGVSIAFTAGASQALACDFDGDGDCDFIDIDDLYDRFGAFGTSRDLNENGVVDDLDIVPWLAAASSTNNPFNTNSSTFVLGDLDLNGDVDSVDLGDFLVNFNDDTGLKYRGGNLNDDAVVDSSDLGELLLNFGMSSSSLTVVPEPDFFNGLLALVVLALAQSRSSKL